MIKPFTVVVLRPEYLNAHPETEYGQDIYVAHVRSTEPAAAFVLAQMQVFRADQKDKLKPKKPTDYKLVVAFEGHHDPKLFGWQPH